MKINSAFVLAAIIFTIGAMVFFYTVNEKINYGSTLPAGNVLSFPDSYDRDAAERVLIEFLNARYVSDLPVLGALFGVIMFSLSLVCVWLGFVFRGYEKRIAILEKKNT